MITTLFTWRTPSTNCVNCKVRYKLPRSNWIVMLCQWPLNPLVDVMQRVDQIRLLYVTEKYLLSCKGSFRKRARIDVSKLMLTNLLHVIWGLTFLICGIVYITARCWIGEIDIWSKGPYTQLQSNVDVIWGITTPAHIRVHSVKKSIYIYIYIYIYTMQLIVSLGMNRCMDASRK